MPATHLVTVVSGRHTTTLKGVAWTKYTKTYADLAAASLTNDIELFQLAAGEHIDAAKTKQSVSFLGGAITAYTLSLGIAGNLVKYVPVFDVFQAVGNTVKDFRSFGPYEESHGSTTSVRLSAISVLGLLDAATQGSVDIWVRTAILL